MKSSKIFNNISEKLKNQIPKLKPGQSVVFKMLNGVPNPEPDEKERSKDPVLYPKVQLLTKFRIFDPYQNPYEENGETKYSGGYVDIGCVDAWRGEEPISFRCFVTGKNNNRTFMSRFPGQFELKGGNVQDEELFEIFWLSPQREGSPCADSNVEVIFKILDAKADSKLITNKFDTLRKAIDLAKAISPEKAKEVMAALNKPSYQDDDILLAKTRELASSEPDEFIRTYESAETPIRAVIKEALDRGILSHDLATGEVKLGGVKLIDFKTQDVLSFAPEFSKWINTAANGKEVLNNIKSRLIKKEDKVKQ